MAAVALAAEMTVNQEARRLASHGHAEGLKNKEGECLGSLRIYSHKYTSIKDCKTCEIQYRGGWLAEAGSIHVFLAMYSVPKF